ncbi:hypothetical protein CBL_08526 [Carabus blaptoides fortunei]
MKPSLASAPHTKVAVGWLSGERPRVAFWGCSLLCGPQNKFKYEYLAWYWQMGNRIWFDSTLLFVSHRIKITETKELDILCGSIGSVVEAHLLGIFVSTTTTSPPPTNIKLNTNVSYRSLIPVQAVTKLSVANQCTPFIPSGICATCAVSLRPLVKTPSTCCWSNWLLYIVGRSTM